MTILTFSIQKGQKLQNSQISFNFSQFLPAFSPGNSIAPSKHQQKPNKKPQRKCHANFDKYEENSMKFRKNNEETWS